MEAEAEIHSKYSPKYRNPGSEREEWQTNGSKPHWENPKKQLNWESGKSWTPVWLLGNQNRIKPGPWMWVSARSTGQSLGALALEPGCIPSTQIDFRSPFPLDGYYLNLDTRGGPSPYYKDLTDFHDPHVRSHPLWGGDGGCQGGLGWIEGWEGEGTGMLM